MSRKEEEAEAEEEVEEHLVVEAEVEERLVVDLDPLEDAEPVGDPLVEEAVAVVVDLSAEEGARLEEAEGVLKGDRNVQVPNNYIYEHSFLNMHSL
jgi:hypothetical protein